MSLWKFAHICCSLFAKQLSLGADYTAGLQDEAVMSLIMMTSVETFAEKQGWYFPPGSETSSIGRVVPWSRSANRRQSSSWLPHKLLIQLFQMSTHTTRGPCQVATSNYYHPYEDMWMGRIKCPSPSPLFHLISPMPSLFSTSFSFLQLSPFTLWKERVDLRRRSRPANLSAFSRLNEEMNEWMNQPFTVGNFVGASAAPGWCRTEPFQAERPDVIYYRLSPGTFARKHVLPMHITD